MKSASRISAIALCAALVLALYASTARADAPPTIPAWFNNSIVYIIPGVSPNVVGVTNPTIAAKVANPLYVVAGSQSVNHVLGVAIPGVAGYNPYWDLVFVTVLDGRNLVTHPFTSEAGILMAWANGEVSLDDSGFILLCQVVRK